MISAASQGAVNAVSIVLNVIATLIAVLAFVAFLNGILSWLGSIVGLHYMSFEFLLSKLFIPFAWLMGIEEAVSFPST